MSTVPMFAPDGSLGDVPYENMHAALAAGAKPGVNVKAPDGSVGVVPADRLQEAAKAGGRIIPFEAQEVEHPGFWGAVKSYFSGFGSEDLAKTMQRMQTDPDSFSHFPKAPTAEENAQRKAQGLGPTYRALVPVAESLGMNVKGTEEAARQGDTAGVAGYAAVPAAAAVIAPLAEKASGRLTRSSNQIPQANALKSIPVSETADAMPSAQSTALGRIPVAESAVPQGKFSDAGLRLREWWRQRGGGLADGPIDRATMQGGPPIGQKQALLRQAEALKQPVHDIVDAAIPPAGETKASNLLTKARIDFQLQHGNVDGAQAILESAKPKPITPLPELQTQTGTPSSSQFPPDKVPYRGTTNDIREELKTKAARADLTEDQAIQQEMNWNLERHGWSAESEARREFIARNSTGMTKGELNRQFDAAMGKTPAPAKPVKYTKTPGVNAAPPPGTVVPGEADLEEILRKSLEAAKAKKQ